jgi:arylformamidase
MKCYDVSRSLQNTLAPWPGDTPFHFRLTAQLGQGAVVNVGAMSMGLHNGTHADAPFHYVAAGECIDSVPLDLFMGPAVVVDVSKAGWTITREHLAHAQADFAATGRLVLKTGTWPDSTQFPEKIPTLAADVPAWLGGAGVRLIALDVPSVDAIDSKTLPVHLALAAANIYIIESLDLGQVKEGIYELIALPLKITGGDASPVRAVLREIAV